MTQARQFGDVYQNDLVLNLVVVLSALAGLKSLRVGGLRFSLATVNVVPGYFHRKIEEK